MTKFKVERTHNVDAAQNENVESVDLDESGGTKSQRQSDAAPPPGKLILQTHHMT